MGRRKTSFIDLTGKRFGNLVVIARANDHISKSGKTKTVVWRCRCDCGNEVEVQGLNLRNGHIKSCGCYRSKFSRMKLDNLTGKRFGKLLVLERAENQISQAGHPTTMWKCQCDCGNIAVVNAQLLKRGSTQSCGCKVNVQNGLSRTRQYSIWNQMTSRCKSKKNQAYADYGGRGIKVCDEWSGENGFINFYNWAMNNGYRDDLTIDRINVNGNYEPSNCRWRTQKEQQNNRRNNRFLEFSGQSHTIAEWSDITGINPGTIRTRLKLGWPIEDVLTKKVSR